MLLYAAGVKCAQPRASEAQLGAEEHHLAWNSVGVQLAMGLREGRCIYLPRVSLRFTRGYVLSRPAVLVVISNQHKN